MIKTLNVITVKINELCYHVGGRSVWGECLHLFVSTKILVCLHFMETWNNLLLIVTAQNREQRGIDYTISQYSACVILVEEKTEPLKG